LNIRWSIILFLIIPLCIFAEEIIELNFFNQPKFDFFDFDTIENKINTVFDDSISTNIFCGKILDEAESDIFVLAFLNAVGCDVAIPTDYQFRSVNRNLNFQLLASNVKSDSLIITEEIIVSTDSLRVGIFSLVSPDFLVKNDIDPNLKFDYDIFEVAERKANELAEKTDFVIMLSNMTRYIDNDITRDLPVDFVFSFDYQIKEEGLLKNGSTYFTSLDSGKGIFGKLRLRFHNNEILYSWEELEF